MTVRHLEEAAARCRDEWFAAVLRNKAGQAAAILDGVPAPVLNLPERPAGGVPRG